MAPSLPHHPLQVERLHLKAPGPEILHRLRYFRLGIHHERAVLRNRLVQRASRHQQHAARLLGFDAHAIGLF